MAAPVAKSFAALCNSLKIKLESKKATQMNFLRSAGANFPANSSGPQIKELSASLAWVHTSLSNGGEPDAWPNTLDASMLATLLSLYSLPRPNTTQRIPTSSVSPPQSASSHHAAASQHHMTIPTRKPTRKSREPRSTLSKMTRRRTTFHPLLRNRHLLSSRSS
jgi:hypothetical protein